MQYRKYCVRSGKIVFVETDSFGSRLVLKAPRVCYPLTQRSEIFWSLYAINVLK